MLDKLLFPKSVAVFGASRTPGKVGHDILANLINGGYEGTIIPVNPQTESVLGLPCLPALTGSGQNVDMAVLVVPRAMLFEAAKDAVRAGAGALIAITAGFKETGAEGAALEREIASFCAAHKVQLLGPNCLGLINTTNRMNASFAGIMPESGGISVFSQSGALCTALLDLANGRRLGISKVVSIGNKALLTEVDLLRALARDPDTKVIVGYLEDIPDGDEFVKAAEEASSAKPVIILKSGTTAAGQRAASSHTGVLAGMDTAYAAAFKRAGVIRADTFESLIDYTTALSMQPLPAGKRVAIITNAGGPGAMAADAVEREGLEVAPLDSFAAGALREKLPRAASVANPIDVLGDADPERYVAALQVADADPAVDAIVILMTPQAMTRPAETARAIAANLSNKKPVVAAFMGGQGVMPGREELAAASLPDYESPERAVAVLRAMSEYAAWRVRPPRMVTRFRVHRRRVERIISRRMRFGVQHLGEARSKEVLRAYGFSTPSGALAATVEDAIEISKRIGFPVAMKIVSPDIVHKSDMGGVKLNIASAPAVEDAFDLMLMRIRQRAPNARIEGVYVEKMLEPGLEVIIGMTRDPRFGPMLMFGLGGIFVEVMKDVTFHLAPITRDEAVQMLKATRSYGILEGRRGRKGVDLGAIANGLQRISQLTTDFPQITELDINPFIVGEMGTDPIVADARITLEQVAVGTEK